MTSTHEQGLESLKIIGAETRLNIISALQDMVNEKSGEIRKLAEEFSVFRKQLAEAHDSNGQYSELTKARDAAWKLVSDGELNEFLSNIESYRAKQAEVEKIEDLAVTNYGGMSEATHVAKTVAAQFKIQALLEQMSQVATNALENLRKTELDK